VAVVLGKAPRVLRREEGGEQAALATGLPPEPLAAAAASRTGKVLRQPSPGVEDCRLGMLTTGLPCKLTIDAGLHRFVNFEKSSVASESSAAATDELDCGHVVREEKD